MSGQIRLRARYKKYVTPWFDYLLVSKDEMEDILDGTGWVVRKYLDTEGAAGYIAVMDKKKAWGGVAVHCLESGGSCVPCLKEES